MLNLLLDGNGFVLDFGINCGIGGVDFDITPPDDFIEKWKAYKIVDGKLVLDETKRVSVEEDFEIQQLRDRRESECFSVINRGELWYKRLTNEQLDELNAWYDAWLNVTATKVIPELPTFI